MCLGIPAKIVSIEGKDRAKVSISGVLRNVSTDLITEPIAQGDWLLIHVGFALSKIDEEEAATTLQQIQQLGANTFEDELDSFKTSDI
ncbi:HypC/HybG/HupF family hydrogenase formation chaperone [Corynebacterium pelargi]|uniref:Hydrogenase isoenzymes formation protein HypC n=1 Tax=Corynebacterium pelargi TaxID=1471400 RepID=A0A410WBU5_9CORY|nr:HypC/HybG/HupF family hydrogenase formation chaperone [Corynebacterium pelargi]QAU53427.1 Hydrogenase isoenzymes formation protein HypC [Corynebacterium pelargi]GGG82091.1 hydrogenase assembly protein HupF [Corynebacterium pelargi]